MTQPQRLPVGGLIDRGRALAFSFNGRAYQGFEGDTLASALLANGVHLVGRSFKYHRPRGFVGHGAEEPNALVRLDSEGGGEPNARATQVPLREGLQASSQHCWPSVEFDLGAVNNVLSRLLPAGFYYKTFMWPASMWMAYERLIRRSAGLGRVPSGPDSDRYLHRHEHCDVLVVGAGPSGLAAALAAGRAGARVVLTEQDWRLGGRLLSQDALIDGAPGLQWVADVESELSALHNVRVLPRSTAFGYFDHNLLGIEERPAWSGSAPALRRLWKVRAARVVLATGALERMLVFANNDLPGILLAHSVQAYLNRFAVLPGRRAVVFTNNDSAYHVALDLARAREASVTLVDVRDEATPQLRKAVEQAGVTLRVGAAVVRARGSKRVAVAEVARVDGDGHPLGRAERIDCDLVCVAGGWSPTVHLFSQSKGKLRFDQRQLAFVPERSAQAERSAGAAAGRLHLAACLADGHAAGLEAASLAGFEADCPSLPPVAQATEESAPKAWWMLNSPLATCEKSFVDFQNDVTVADIRLAAREGYVSVEHLKRYTTLGMGTDQGKLSNVTGLAILADTLGAEIGAVGTTTFRPPYSPVTFGTLAGAERGRHFAPLRRSAMDAWHAKAGARFVNAGLWRRPQLYPQPGECEFDAVNREARAVRSGVGLVDVSTLGKIDIKGRDAAEFLERVYTNHWKKLAVGKVRYGVMLREDGMVYDDGTTARLGERHYLMTTTTANAVKVISNLEQWLQVHWQDLRVSLTSVTEHWAAMALAGPRSRAVLERLAPKQDWSGDVLPHLGLRECVLKNVPARVFRISYSGELAFEINVPADYGLEIWEALFDAGKPLGIMPYGTDAMGVLRIEKGHIAGPEIDGRTTPGDLGLDALVSKTKDFIGRRSLRRRALLERTRRQLVGLVATDSRSAIPPGAQLINDPSTPSPVDIHGHVTSCCWSPALGKSIALALLAGGRARHGEALWASSPLLGEAVQVVVGSPVFFDPEGERVRV
jgi:sarcosine oxidase subunit alpha